MNKISQNVANYSIQILSFKAGDGWLRKLWLSVQAWTRYKYLLFKS